MPGSVTRRPAIGDGRLRLLLRGGEPRGGGAFLIPGGDGGAGGRRLAAALPSRPSGRAETRPRRQGAAVPDPGMSPGSPERDEGPRTSGNRDRDPGEPGPGKGWE